MRFALATMIVALGACGGVGVAAPVTLGADEDTGCPSADDALAHANDALGGPKLDALRPVLHRVLVDEGGLRVLLRTTTLLLSDTQDTTLPRLLHGLDPAQGLGAVTPHLVDVLQYVDGSSPFVAGAHEEPVAALHSILATCDAAKTTSTLRRLLELEVTVGADGKPALAAPGTGDRAWLSAVLEASRVAFEDDNVKTALQGIELDDGEGQPGSIHLGKDAFELLAKLLAANLAAPNFDPHYTQDLLDQVIVSRITDDAARAKIDDFLALVLLVTDENADVFPQVQSLMSCVNDTDVNAAIPGMLYDYLTIPEFSVNTLLDDLSTSTGSTSAGDLRVAVVDVLAALESNPDLARDTIAVIAKLIDGDAAPILVHTLLALRGAGVVGELVHLTDAVKQCRGSP